MSFLIKPGLTGQAAQQAEEPVPLLATRGRDQLQPSGV